MKNNFVRVIALILVLLFVLSLMPVIFTRAAEMNGIAFKAEEIYKPSKKLDTTPNTFEAWVKFPKNMSSGTRGGVILGNYGSGNPCISFEVHQKGMPRLYLVEANGTVYDWKFTSVNVYTGEWIHMTIVRDNAARQAHCYINGELKQTLSVKATPDIIPVMPLFLGGDHRSGNAQYFKGELAGVAVYSDIRTADEIKADMTAPAKDSLLLHYDLSSLTSTDSIPDLGGNGYDAKKSVMWITKQEEPKDYAFSFMAIGDTQIVAEKHPAYFHKIYDYVVDNIEKKNVKFVFGLGDITNKSTQAEWDVSTENIFKMDGKVPYSIVRGNHDKAVSFKTAFPLSKYQSVLGGTYLNSMLNTWQTFSVGSIKYLVFTLDYGAADDVLDWAGRIISEHPDHNVIITTHAYLFRDGTTLDKNDVCPPSTSGGYNNGDDMWEKLIKKHENIVLVISGHDPCSQIITTQTKGDNGNTVTQMLIDGQGVDSSLGGVGLVATFYFSEDGRDVTVDYYSTIKEKYFMTENCFSFTLDLIGSAEETTANTDGAQSTTVEQTEETTPSDTTVPEEKPVSYTVPIVLGVASLTAIASGVLLQIVKKKRGVH